MIKKQLLMYCSPVCMSAVHKTKVDGGPGVTYSMQLYNLLYCQIESMRYA